MEILGIKLGRRMTVESLDQNAEEVKEETGALKVEKPEPEKVKVSKGLRRHIENYHKEAKTIKFEPAALIIERLKIFFADNGIPIYDRGKVYDYLDRKAAEQPAGEKKWGWLPLREKDEKAELQTDSDRKNPYTGNDDGKILGGRYHDFVPLPILQLVKKINNEFPMLRFYVSHVGKDPDPFVMVTGVGPDELEFIFAHFNEPDFK